MIRKRLRQGASKLHRMFLKWRGSFLFALFIIGFAVMIGWTWHNDNVRHEVERKDCQQYRDTAQRDTPMRCMHYWEQDRHD